MFQDIHFKVAKTHVKVEVLLQILFKVFDFIAVTDVVFDEVVFINIGEIDFKVFVFLVFFFCLLFLTVHCPHTINNIISRYTKSIHYSITPLFIIIFNIHSICTTIANINNHIYEKIFLNIHIPSL